MNNNNSKRFARVAREIPFSSGNSNKTSTKPKEIPPINVAGVDSWINSQRNKANKGVAAYSSTAVVDALSREEFCNKTVLNHLKFNGFIDAKVTTDINKSKGKFLVTTFNFINPSLEDLKEIEYSDGCLFHRKSGCTIPLNQATQPHHRYFSKAYHETFYVFEPCEQYSNPHYQSNGLPTLIAEELESVLLELRKDQVTNPKILQVVNSASKRFASGWGRFIRKTGMVNEIIENIVKDSQKISSDTIGKLNVVANNKLPGPTPNLVNWITEKFSIKGGIIRNSSLIAKIVGDEVADRILREHYPVEWEKYGKNQIGRTIFDDGIKHEGKTFTKSGKTEIIVGQTLPIKVIGETSVTSNCDEVDVKPGSSVRKVTLKQQLTGKDIKAILPYVECDKVQFMENSNDNLVEALKTRQLKLAPKITPKMSKEYKSVFKELAPKTKVNVQSFEEWKDSRKWNNVKIEATDRAYSGNILEIKPNLRRKHFVKAEIIPDKDNTKAGRVVTEYSRQVQAAAGRLVCSIKEIMKEKVQLQDGITVIFSGGKTREELGDDMKYAIEKVNTKPFFLNADFSKFDSTISATHMELTHEFMKECIPVEYHQVIDAFNKIEIKDIVKAVSKTLDGYVTARVPASRGSGSPMTYVGNSLLAAVFAILKVRKSGIKPYDIQRTTIMCSGDDLNLVGNERTIELVGKDIEKFAETCGHKIEASITSDLLEVIYLQGMFLKTRSGSYVHVCNPIRILKKTPLTVKKFPREKDRATLACSKASGVVDTLWYLRPIKLYFERFIAQVTKEFGIKDVIAEEKFLKYSTKIKERQLADGELQNFLMKFGIDTTLWIDFEKYMQKLPMGAVELRHPVIAQFLTAL